MRLTPCPVALPRSWLASAAASVTIGELEEEEHSRRGLTFLLSGLDDEEQIHARACVEINQSRAPNDSSLRHFSVMTRPCWLRRAARNRHRVDGVEDDTNAP